MPVLPYRRFLSLTLALTVAGCVAAPPPRALPPPPSFSPPVAAAPDLSVLAAPARGQSAEDLSRDRYECSLWATRQTGYSPANPPFVPARTVALQPVPVSGSGVFGGAMLGAIIGSAVGNPWHNGPSTLIGLATGAVVGGAAEAVATQHAQEANRAAIDEAQAEALSSVPAAAGDYRRALAACLEGRGYAVR